MFLANFSFAEIYKYVDNNGTTVFTDTKSVNSIYTAYIPQKVHKNKSAYKSINQTTNTTTDVARRKLLQEELLHEQKALINIQQTLNSTKTKMINEKNSDYQDRLSTLKSSIIEHKKNIQLLQQLLK